MRTALAAKVRHDSRVLGDRIGLDVHTNGIVVALAEGSLASRPVVAPTKNAAEPTRLRLPGRNPRDDFVDILRGLAIFFVLILHSLGPSGIDPFEWRSGLFPNFDISPISLLLLPATLGWAGVAIFFAVSGFCIHNSYTRERHFGTTRYLIKRTFRIYPPYITSLLIFYLWIATGGMAEYGIITDQPRNLLTHALLLHNFSFTYIFGINPSYWSIAVEFQLYLLYIPLIKFIDRFGWQPVMAAAFLIEIGIRSMEAYYFTRYGEVPKHLAGMPLGFIFSWSVGALVAEWCNSNRQRHLVVKRWHIIALVSSAVAFAFCKPLNQFAFMLFSLSSAAMICYAYHNNIKITRYMRWFVSLGVVSYSVYLIHQPLVLLVPKVYQVLDISPPQLVVFMTCVAMVVPLFWCSRIMRKVVELPSVNLGYRLLGMLASVEDRLKQCLVKR